MSNIKICEHERIIGFINGLECVCDLCEKMGHWHRTSDIEVPSNVELLFSDGNITYIGTYRPHSDLFYDREGRVLLTPYYWQYIPKLPEENKNEL